MHPAVESATPPPLLDTLNVIQGSTSGRLVIANVWRRMRGSIVQAKPE
jgi:hypothetical protein